MSEPRRHELGACIDGSRCKACGHPLPEPPRPETSDWGDWQCESCGAAHCQDGAPWDPCGKVLDWNSECPDYVAMVQAERDASAPL